ncbi:Sucrase/ferredoxin-like-domain-containing protein [Sporodiniella umbellata]|nr:Sucrase/ferredoxin-like-domain-containing protein [Sporodiniella umbellata]
MTSLLKRLGSFIYNSPSEREAKVSVEKDQMPPADVTVPDCNTCALDCDEHTKYPSYLQLDDTSPLLGSMSPYGRHLLISTAQCDWPQRIEEDEGTLAAELHKLVSAQPMAWRTMITNTSHIPSHATTVHCAMDIIILPDNIVVGNVTPDDAGLIYDLFVKRPLPETPLIDTQEAFQQVDLQDLAVYPNPYHAMILICSHRKRDKRCGITAPILNREFDHILREKDIHDGPGGTTVLMASHIGGHKFAGNIICYINHGLTGIWYGRVTSCHCRQIIEETILQGKIIKDLYRGCMTHSFHSKPPCQQLQW